MSLADSTQTATTTQLLDSLKDESNQTVWVGFDARYRPIVEGMARRLGLPHEDAADVAQETLSAFVRDYRRGLYQRGKGRLRTWIMTIARNRAVDLLRGRARVPGAHGSVSPEIASDDLLQTSWEAEEERSIFQAALAELRDTTRAEPGTVRAFELTAIQGLASDAAAAECGMTPEQVRMAKHRMTNRLREIVERLTEAYRTDT